MSELVDIVDEQGKPTGQTITSSQAHKDATLHVVVALIIRDSKDRYIVQYRKPNKGYRLFDVSVGGHVDSGEQPINAVIREAQEELGIKFAASDLSEGPQRFIIDDVYPQFDVNARHVGYVWFANAPEEWEFVPNDEVTEVICMRAGELSELVSNRSKECTVGMIKALQLTEIVS